MVKKYIVRVERILRELEVGQIEIKEMIGAETGNLSIAVTLPNIFPKILVEFLTKYPHVKITQILAYSANEIIRQLSDGDIDLCIKLSLLVTQVYSVNR
ncbi:hypothetical protein ACIQYS_03255 [Psychrobacillus sp. NPDC096426]|uniref:hypothetical protein n=1 Tax=Psychrobacillus sp. NPDC096426 TaxID=3364491 RepID=UPI003815E5C6